jgi:hypothetical protein
VADGVPALPADDVKELRTALQRWVARARGAGLDDDDIGALFWAVVRPLAVVRVA